MVLSYSTLLRRWMALSAMIGVVGPELLPPVAPVPAPPVPPPVEPVPVTVPPPVPDVAMPVVPKGPIFPVQAIANDSSPRAPTTVAAFRFRFALRDIITAPFAVTPRRRGNARRR